MRAGAVGFYFAALIAKSRRVFLAEDIGLPDVFACTAKIVSLTDTVSYINWPPRLILYI